MKPRNQEFCLKPKQELFRHALIDMVNEEHPLVNLGTAINWKKSNSEFEKFYTENTGRPAILTRIMYTKVTDVTKRQS